MSESRKNIFQVRWIKFSSGERMPFLVRISTGIPISSAMYWIIAHRRAGGRQPNTLCNELRALMFLFLWADARGIDVEERLREGTFFTLTEVIDLANVCGQYIDHILSKVNVDAVHSLKCIGKSRKKRASIKSSEKRNRLAAVRSFVEFTSADILSQLSPWPHRWNFYNDVRDQCLGFIEAQTGPAPKHSNDMGMPEGLNPDTLARLRSVIEPNHPENPFSPNVRFRNYLLIRMLIEAGLRRGELLGIRVSDCSLGRDATIAIHRRPDDPDDPRLYKPSTKTAARLLALSGRTSELLHEYVVRHRSKIPGARGHPFLFVDVTTGLPLSLSSVNKILRKIRKKFRVCLITLPPIC